jgi:hypothetical protein
MCFDPFGALNGAAAARTDRADGFVSANAVSPPARKLGAFRLRGTVKMITRRDDDRAIELRQARRRIRALTVANPRSTLV